MEQQSRAEDREGGRGDEVDCPLGGGASGAAGFLSRMARMMEKWC